METKTNPLNLTPEQLDALAKLDPDEVADDARNRLVAATNVELPSNSLYVRSFRYSVYDLALYAMTGRNRMEAMDQADPGNIPQSCLTPIIGVLFASAVLGFGLSVREAVRRREAPRPTRSPLPLRP